jgi:Fur family iron response transcriptional regulator
VDTSRYTEFVNRDDIVRLLERNNVQATAQRVEIAGLILDRPQHLSADEVLRRLHEIGARVSKATVYNTLKLFCDRGLLRTVDVDPVRQFYDSRTQPHHHFFNVDTGELTDIDPEDIDLSVAADLPQGTIREGAEVLIRVREQHPR